MCEEDIRKYDESVPEVVPLVKGTMGIHQILSTEPGTILHRELSCFCSRPDICQCYKTTMISFRTSSAEASVNVQQDLTGKFVIVRYEEQPFVGQVLQVFDEELEVSCMQQLGSKNAFTWPHPADVTFYYHTDVLKIISEPEPLNSRHTRLNNANWDCFSRAA